MSVQSKHLPAEQRRATTVEAMIALAAEQNPSDITTAAIAQRMGLTQGALFRHFPSKDHLLEAVMTWVAGRLLKRVEAATRSDSPIAALEAVFMAHVGFVAEHPGVPRMIFGELQRPGTSASRVAVQAMLEAYGARLRSLLESGKAQGEVDPSLDVGAAAVLFIGTIQGLVMQSLLVGDATHIRRNAPGAFAIYRRGIASAP